MSCNNFCGNNPCDLIVAIFSSHSYTDDISYVREIASKWGIVHDVKKINDEVSYYSCIFEVVYFKWNPLGDGAHVRQNLQKGMAYYLNCENDFNWIIKNKRRVPHVEFNIRSRNPYDKKKYKNKK